jgi:rRNA maturation RNase YbeY
MVNVIFINDRRMIELNSTYLHHRYTTDVISFLLTEKHSDLLEGEVYINLDQTRRQAKEYKVTFSSEKLRLVAHGVLHLAGYDDATPMKRRRMSRLEDKYLFMHA